MKPLEERDIQLMSHTVEIKCHPEVWRLGDKANQVFRSALHDAISTSAYTMLPEHLIGSMSIVTKELLSHVNPQYVLPLSDIFNAPEHEYKPRIRDLTTTSNLGAMPSNALKILEHAVVEARNVKAPYVDVEHLLLSLCKTAGTAMWMRDRGFHVSKIYEVLKQKKKEELIRFIHRVKEANHYDDYQLTGKVFVGQYAKYKLLNIIEIGGMGAVYAALRFPKEIATIPEKLDDALQYLPTHLYPVCIKYLKPEVIANFKNRFIKEIKIIENLVHPNIVRIFDSGETKEGRLFFVMEWVDGCSLEEYITNTSLTKEDSLLIIEQTCLALHFAHQEKVYHLDVKPGNVMLLQSDDKTMQVKLIDFGLAKVAADVGMTTTLTQLGGTSKYCAPEVYNGKASQKSDVFSLGVMLYEILTGVMPLGTSYLFAKQNPNANLPLLPSVTQQRADLSPEIDKVIAKAHQRNPRNRQKSALDFLAEYRYALGLYKEAASAPETSEPMSKVEAGISTPQTNILDEHIAATYPEVNTGGEASVPADTGIKDQDQMAIPIQLLRQLSSEQGSERAAAVKELSRFNGEDAFREINASFDDPEQEVRNAAARSLYESNPDRAASFTRALREATSERRRRIGSAISSSGLAKEAIGHLMGESREETYDAFSLLFLMSKAGEAHPLIRAIEEHPNNEVRLAIVKLLALVGQQENLPALRRLAVRGSLPTEVRSAVMEAIFQISSQHVIPVQVPQQEEG